MLTALVLICSVVITPDLQACSGENAQSVIRVPTDDGSPVGCLLHGQAYLAEAEIGQDLAADERVKVVCTPQPASRRHGLAPEPRRQEHPLGPPPPFPCALTGEPAPSLT